MSKFIDWLHEARKAPIADIGQIPPEQIRKLKAAVRRREIKAVKAPWCTDIHPNGFAFLGAGPTKTYYLPGYYRPLTSNYARTA